MSKTEVFGISISFFLIGLGLTLGIPNFYRLVNHIVLLVIDRVILPYSLVWMIAVGLFIVFFGIAYIYYEEQLATFYRVFWIWGTTAIFSWFGGVVILYDPLIGILLWGVGISLGLMFRWLAPPLTKFLIWREASY